jgi:hypothetical protein
MPLPMTQPAEARTSVVGKPLSRHSAASIDGLACPEPCALHHEEDRRPVGLDAPLVGRQVVSWVLSRPPRGRGGTSSSVEQMNAWRSMAAFDKTVLVRYLVQDDAIQLAAATGLIRKCVSAGPMLFIRFPSRSSWSGSCAPLRLVRDPSRPQCQECVGVQPDDA